MITKRRLLGFVTGILCLVGLLILQAQERRDLTVFAAASLSDAFEAIASEFEADNPGVNVLFNFGGSSTLATQLVQGAPADVFASANPVQMQVVVDGERIAGSPLNFARNRLVLIVPVDNPAHIQNLHDLAKPDVNLVLAAPSVPVRAYTDVMLDKMAATTAYGEAYREAVLANLVSEEPNVRQVSAKVALGEADAGIVYLSDVTRDIADDVMALPIPDVFNMIATYPIAVTDDTNQPELAEQFVDFVLSDGGQDILIEWGFVSINVPETPDSIHLPADGTLSVDGQVSNPLSLTVDALRTGYEAQIVDVSYIRDDEVVTSTFTGVLLWDVIQTAQPVLNADVLNDQLGMYLVVTGADGYQVVIAWGEIDPAFSHQPILIAYEDNGDPVSDGTVRLVVPADRQGGRYVHDVVNISLRDAPPAAREPHR